MTYGDGSILSADDYTVTGYNKNQLGEQTITVTSGDYSDTFTVTVEDYVTGIEMKTLPTKLEYEIGEELNVAGGKVQINKASGATTEMDLTDEMVSGFSSAEAGEVTITVTLGDFETSFSVTIKAAPQSSSEAPVSSEVPTSSETPVESSEQPASSEAPASSEPTTPVAKGCGGSLSLASGLVTLISLVGIVLLSKKKD